MDDFKDFFHLLKQYLQQEKESMALGAAEKMTIILSAVTCVLVCILFVCAIIFFFTFAIAIWLGEAIGINFIGFVIMGAFLLLLTFLFWIKRKTWVEKPIARLMVEIFLKEIDK